MNVNEVIRLKHCANCGRVFELRYNKVTGEALQTWQKGCDTLDECFRKYMPKSDFTPH